MRLGTRLRRHLNVASRVTGSSHSPSHSSDKLIEYVRCTFNLETSYMVGMRAVVVGFRYELIILSAYSSTWG